MRLDLFKNNVYNSHIANREIKKEKRNMENDNKIPGKGAATASMVLGIISVVL